MYLDRDTLHEDGHMTPERLSSLRDGSVLQHMPAAE